MIQKYDPMCGTRSEGRGLTWDTIRPEFSHLSQEEREYYLAKLCLPAPLPIVVPEPEQPLPNTIEFQEIIPGVKPPRVPILIPGLENLPLLPGWIIRDAKGSIMNAGLRIPVLQWETVKPPEEPVVVPTTPPEEGGICAIEGLQYGNLRCLQGKWRLPVGTPEEGALGEEELEL
jgi:hypothetical protein